MITVSEAPERSHQQRMEALVKANEIRTLRAQLKKDVKFGCVSVIPFLLEPPEWVKTMRAFELLLGVPKFGKVKINRIFVQCHISPSKTIGGLTARQRRELVSYFF